MPEGFNQDSHIAPLINTATALAPHVVHVTPATRNEIHYDAPPSVNMVSFTNDDIYRPFPPPSEGLGLYDRRDDF